MKTTPQSAIINSDASTTPDDPAAPVPGARAVKPRQLASVQGYPAVTFQARPTPLPKAVLLFYLPPKLDASTDRSGRAGAGQPDCRASAGGIGAEVLGS